MEIWAANTILAPLPGDAVAWSVDPLATGAWDARSEAPERQVRAKLRPAKRKSWRSFLGGGFDRLDRHVRRPRRTDGIGRPDSGRDA